MVLSICVYVYVNEFLFLVVVSNVVVLPISRCLISDGMYSTTKNAYLQYFSPITIKKEQIVFSKIHNRVDIFIDRSEVDK